MRNSKEMLDMAQAYADLKSTCVKVKVGSAIETLPKDGLREVVFGCNHGVCDCKTNGCRRKKLYGEASKAHRLPSDCDSIHSEIDAISRAARQGAVLEGATIWVTRYPCEACARAIRAAGIHTVIYGRKETVSEYTKQILEGLDLIHADDWDREDNNE